MIQRTHKKSSVIFLGRKQYAAQALEFLLRKDILVKFVVAPKVEQYTPSLFSISSKYKIPLIIPNDLYVYIKKNPEPVDLVISYLYWKVIRKPLIDLGKNGCINYHNAILPQYKGLGGYNLAILHQLKEWGSTVHYIDSESIDSGPIIEFSRFSIDPDQETAWSLDKKTQTSMLSQFKKNVLKLIRNRVFKTYPNTGGEYFSKSDYDKYKRLDLMLPAAEIERKIRAFWFPPYDGAFIEKDNQRFTLVTNNILKTIKIN